MSPAVAAHPALADPTLAYILLALGVYALIYEVSHPGAIAPGVLGILSLAAGLLGLAMLPVSLTGLALVVLGFSLLVAEVLVLPGSGALAASGLGSLVVGSLLLAFASGPGARVSVGVVAGVILASAGFFAVLTRSVLLVRRRPLRVGPERLIGASATALTDVSPVGQIRVGGEIWEAAVAPGFPPIREGEPVLVLSRAGLTLTVVPSAVVRLGVGAGAPEEH